MYYAIVGFARQPHRNRMENVAMTSDLFVSVVLLGVCAIFGIRSSTAADLNYDELIPLDAEALAETGVKAAYERPLPTLRKYVASPAEVSELIDHDVPSLLTPAEAEAAKKSLPRKVDWPYLPDAKQPAYGQYH